MLRPRDCFFLIKLGNVSDKKKSLRDYTVRWRLKKKKCIKIIVRTLLNTSTENLNQTMSTFFGSHKWKVLYGVTSACLGSRAQKCLQALVSCSPCLDSFFLSCCILRWAVPSSGKMAGGSLAPGSHLWWKSQDGISLDQLGSWSLFQISYEARGMEYVQWPGLNHAHPWGWKAGSDPSIWTMWTSNRRRWWVSKKKRARLPEKPDWRLNKKTWGTVHSSPLQGWMLL